MLRKAFAYCLMFTGMWLAYKQLNRVRQEDFLIGVMLMSFFFLLYLIPMVVFGAKIHAKEQTLHVQQYIEADIPYSQVLRCFGVVLPPFRIAVIITKRRFPMCVLIEGQGAATKQGSLVEQVRKRMRETDKPGTDGDVF